MHLNGSNNNVDQTHSYKQLPDVERENEIDLIKLFNLLLIHKWVVLLFTILGGLASYSYVKFQTPMYQSSGTIMISQSQNRYSYAGSDLSSLLTTTYGIGVGSTIANELQILKSRKQSYELAKRINEIKFKNNGQKFPILWRNFPEDSTTIGIDTVAARYRSSISFDRVDPASELVRITFESLSPEEAVTVVNQTMDAYSTLSTEQNRTMAVSALSFLREERNRIELRLSASEDSLRKFMNRTQLIIVDPQAEQLISQISQIEIQRQSIEVKMVAIAATITEYEKQLEELKPGLSDRYASALQPIIERFQFKLAELETEKLMLNVKNPSISPDNSEIRRLDREILAVKEQIMKLTDKLFEPETDLVQTFSSNLGGNIGQNILQISTQLTQSKIEKTQLETQQDVLDSYSNTLNVQFNSLPDEIIQLSRLQRDVKINEALYLLIANQFAEMSLWEKTQFGSGRPLDYATLQSRPVSPKKKILYLIGLFIGGFIGVSIVIIRDLLDDKITSTDSFKEFNLPLLGTIPDFSILDEIDPNQRQFIDNKSISNQLITFLDHISPMSEAYRRLRINVVYANPDKEYKVIMITSATKGEGKSTVVANLAVTFSEAEKRVLVIDLDLRRPTQHKIFGGNREPGLTDFLFETVKLSDISRSTIAPNVDLLTVGKETPEPATILNSKRLKQLIDKLKDSYDHIILDTPPYGIISDSASLLRLVDGLIVVSRFNITTKRELNFTLDGLNHLNADILGFVFNAFNPEKSTDYYTNYAYYKRTYYSEYYKDGK